MKKYLILGLCIVALGFGACEDCAFTSENSTSVVIRFYQQKRDKDQKLVYDTIGVQFEAVNTTVNLPLFTRLSKQSTYALRINPSADTSTFLFETKIDNRIRKDTLIVSYKRKMYLVAPDCGYDEEITDLKIRKNTFESTFLYDSIVILHPNLRIKNVPNIQFFKK